MRPPAAHGYEFGPFRLETSERRLLRDGEPVQLTAKVFDILLVLVEHHGHLLEKADLMQAVWFDSFVEEGNLTRNISMLRKALGEYDGEYIETVPKRGYRFVASVREWSEAGPELIVRERITASAIIEEETEASEQSAAKGAIAVPQAIEIESKKRSKKGWRWLALAVGVAVMGMIAGITYWRKASRTGPAGPLMTVKSLAVLPFKPLSPNESDKYLGMGMADTLITRLSSLQPLVIRPTSAVLKYADQTQDPLAAGREQRVDAVLDASLQRDGEHLRVTVRLLSLRDGAALWAYQCQEVQCDSFFGMQDLISERIAAKLVPHLAGEERKRLRKHDTENKDAQLAFAMGLYFWNKRTPEGMKKGVEYFEQAIAKDPNYARAYVGLANSYSTLANYLQCPSKECYPKAEVAALRALGIDDELAEAHASLAQILHRYEWKWQEAEKEFKRAIELNPGYEYAHQWYGIYLCSLGRFEEAKAELKQALELNPFSLGSNLAYTGPFVLAGEYDQAIAICQKTIELNPNWSGGHHKLGVVYEKKKMYEQAIAEFETAYILDGGRQEISAELKKAYEVSGIKGYWQVGYNLKKGAPPRKDYRYQCAVAQSYARLGWKEEAFYALELAIKYRDDMLVDLKVDPIWDGLRSDPRFDDLLRRVGLAP